MAAIRDLNLKAGASSAFNFKPVSNGLTGDDHAAMEVTFQHQRAEVSDAVMKGALPGGIDWMLFLTGDLAFLNAFYGLQPPPSANGNVWFVNGEERTLESCYTASHCVPCGWDFEARGAVKCPCRGCGWSASSQAEADAELERMKGMGSSELRTHAGSHEGNYPGRALTDLSHPHLSMHAPHLSPFRESHQIQMGASDMG